MIQRIKLSGRNESGLDPSAGSVFFIGTATVLIRLGGYTVLTDPNFLHQGDHAHLGYGMFSKRLTEPALDIQELPPFDLVVLSQYHGHHFDRIVQRELDRGVPIVTTPHAAARLRRSGFRATCALGPWDSVEVRRVGTDPLRITATPAQHGPNGVSWLLPPVMGSVLEFGAGAPFKVFISGDTVIHDEFHDIANRVPDIDLALLHLGGTRILGVPVTMDAGQGVEAVRILDAETAIPIHYDDYTAFKSPLDDFQAAIRLMGLEHKVRYLRHGETFPFRVPTARARRPAAS